MVRLLDFVYRKLPAICYAKRLQEAPQCLIDLDFRSAAAAQGGSNQVTKALAERVSTEMPTEPTQALRFGKARTARSASLVEDYVELIADLLAAHGEARTTDVAKRLGVTHPTAIKSIARLKREGLVTSKPYRSIFLTETGFELANRVRVRHRLMVELLLAVGVPADVTEADAEGMEHYASTMTLEAFSQFLANR